MDESEDLEPVYTDNDSTPRPRRGETVEQLSRRLTAMELEMRGPARSIITDDQLDALVAKIAKRVADTVVSSVRAETTKNVRADVADAFRQLGFLTSKILS